MWVNLLEQQHRGTIEKLFLKPNHLNVHTWFNIPAMVLCWFIYLPFVISYCRIGPIFSCFPVSMPSDVCFVTQLHPTLWDLMDCNLPGSSIHGKNTEVGYHFLLQGIIQTQGSKLRLLYCRWILYRWATSKDMVLRLRQTITSLLV